MRFLSWRLAHFLRDEARAADDHAAIS